MPDDAPELHRVLPKRGPLRGGVTIRLQGASLEHVRRVRWAGQPVDGAVIRENEITLALPPAEQPGYVDVALDFPGGEVLRARAFEYTAAQDLRIVSVSPRSGPPGTEITVVVDGAEPSSRVTVGGRRPLSVWMADDGALMVMVPDGPAGQLVDIEVRNPDGQHARAVRAFRYDTR
jgi:hypothetical protein